MTITCGSVFAYGYVNNELKSAESLEKAINRNDTLNWILFAKISECFEIWWPCNAQVMITKNWKKKIDNFFLNIIAVIMKERKRETITYIIMSAAHYLMSFEIIHLIVYR